MGKIWEKKEYESKKIASTFWWDSALFQIILGIVYLVALVAIGSLITLPLILVAIINIIAGILLTLLSEKIAIKKVRERAIVKKEQVDEIVKKFAIKYVILIAVMVLVEFFSLRLGDLNIVLWIAEALFGTIYAKKLLNELAVD